MIKREKKEKKDEIECLESVTHVLKGLFLLLEPLVGGHQLLLGLIEVVLELLHLLLKIADFLLSLNNRVGRQKFSYQHLK